MWWLKGGSNQVGPRDTSKRAEGRKKVNLIREARLGRRDERSPRAEGRGDTGRESTAGFLAHDTAENIEGEGVSKKLS